MEQKRENDLKTAGTDKMFSPRVSRQWGGEGGVGHGFCSALHSAGGRRRGGGGLQNASPASHGHLE